LNHGQTLALCFAVLLSGKPVPTFSGSTLAVNEPATGPQVTLKIRVIESGEQLDYPLSDVLDDPSAR
jgi:hypothetical protein